LIHGTHGEWLAAAEAFDQHAWIGRPIVGLLYVLTFRESEQATPLAESDAGAAKSAAKSAAM
jgi:hypothetical protein